MFVCNLLATWRFFLSVSSLGLSFVFCSVVLLFFFFVAIEYPPPSSEVYSLLKSKGSVYSSSSISSTFRSVKCFCKVFSHGLFSQLLHRSRLIDILLQLYYNTDHLILSRYTRFFLLVLSNSLTQLHTRDVKKGNCQLDPHMQPCTHSYVQRVCTWLHIAAHPLHIRGESPCPTRTL